ncbi:hypothetical protein HU200_039938 [Digitaria exilis]|uniref:BTB domain-containing protein n=1 Tax=Digitaria exilis TaxID=1010633 RepID=A0A835BHS9_9POAL|nr:hypothetical protein HU200_039938 [Digitaria exilis]
MGPPSKPQSTPPSTTTTSTCTVEAAEGKHLFHVEGYSLHERLVGGGKSVRSATFSVGGYDWAIRYCPTVTRVEEPPSDLSVHLGRLLEEKEGSDVTFDVQGESISAHKIVLAMWSPVFKAKFYGSEMEDSTGRIAVDDVRPAVFRALLHFIYTDSLPELCSDWSDDDRKEMFRNLLVAADHLSTDSVATTLALAEKHNLCNLKDACIEFVALSNKIEDVVASEGYLHLKRSRPSVLLVAQGVVLSTQTETLSNKIFF